MLVRRNANGFDQEIASSVPSFFLGQKVWCPHCDAYEQLLSVQHAARLTDLHRRTIYRYAETGRLHVLRLARTGTIRVCSGCLFRPSPAEDDSSSLASKKE